jgi:hypothetical protein
MEPYLSLDNLNDLIEKGHVSGESQILVGGVPVSEATLIVEYKALSPEITHKIVLKTEGN